MIKVHLKPQIKSLFESNILPSKAGKELNRTHAVPTLIGEKTKEELVNNWNAVIQQVYKKDNTANDKNTSNNTYQDISKKEKIPVRYKDGTISEINPRAIAQMVDSFIQELFMNPQTQIVASYYPKKIIWTTELDAIAATDGIRIFMNPVYVDSLVNREIGRIKDLKKQRKTEIANNGSSDIIIPSMGAAIQFIYIHEAYHQIYRHLDRERLKKETSEMNNTAIHEMANIAQDVEINRDIEGQFSQYAGITKQIGGMWDERFPHEMWEDIFDAYTSGKYPPPIRHVGNVYKPNRVKSTSGGTGGGTGTGGEDIIDLSGLDPDYIKGFNDTIKKIARGEIDVNDPSTYPAMFKTSSFRIKGNASGAYAKNPLVKPVDIQNNQNINIDRNNTPQENLGNIQNQDEYNKGVMDAIERVKALIEAKKNGTAPSKQEVINNPLKDIQMPQSSDNSSDNQQNGNDQNSESSDNQSGNDNNSADNQSIEDSDSILDYPDETDDIFPGNDKITPKEGEEIAKRAGQPYDADDKTTDVNQKTKEFFNKNKEKLRSNKKNPGSGNSLSDVIDTIENLFKPTKNWKTILKKFLNQLNKSKKDYVIQKRRIASQNAMVHRSRYIKYNEEREDQKTGIAQVFYLVDNSGSMYGQDHAGGLKVFNQIFSEILDMQTKAKIQKSGITYFADTDTIDINKIRMWSLNDNLAKVKSMIARHMETTGGTNIVGSIKGVIKLQKPYFSLKNPSTLLIVITDGEDNLDEVANLPYSVKTNMLWLIVNSSKSYLEDREKILTEKGIPSDRILPIDTNEL